MSKPKQSFPISAANEVAVVAERNGEIFVPAIPAAAAERLGRLTAGNMPWLGAGSAAMLAGYDGPEISGPTTYIPYRNRPRNRQGLAPCNQARATAQS